MTFTLLAKSLENIKPSATLAISAKASEMRSRGLDVISLSAGEPDFDTPENVKQKGIEAISIGKTKYTNVDGTSELKEAIVSKFSRENNLVYSLDEITVGAGAKQVIFNAMFATINPGDEVIIPAPYWVSYPEMVNVFGGKSVIVKTKEENSLKITPSELESVITPRTKWFILNSPSNPTGQIYSKQELLGLADVLKKSPNVHVLSDDIYEHLIYDQDQNFYSIAELEPSLQGRTLVVNGVSKSYAMTGWRIGFGGVKNPDLIKAIKKIQSQNTTNPCSISQYAAIEALNNGKGFISTTNEAFKKRRDYVYGELSAMPGISAIKPVGAFYIFFSIAGLIGKTSSGGMKINNCLDFATSALEESKVAMVHGQAFGSENFIRASYATSDKNLEESMKRIKALVSGLS